MSGIDSHLVSLPLGQLVLKALCHLKELGYKSGTRDRYAYVWWNLVGFARGKNESPALTNESAAIFLKNQGVSPRLHRSQKLSWRQKEARRAVRVLLDFQATGGFRRHGKRKSEPPTPEAFAREVHEYGDYCRLFLHHRPVTLAARCRTSRRFGEYLGSREIHTPAGIDAESLSAFIAMRARFLQPCSLATEVGNLRSFLRFLCMRGLVSADLVANARALRFAREHRLPPVWPPTAVDAVLAAADRSSCQGKRDYAILLLACRLGLRASDIRTLRLEDIHWSEASIHLKQRKTGRPLSLPLEDEVGKAIIDYLLNARPAVQHREVFLKVRAPNEPFGTNNPLHSVVAHIARVPSRPSCLASHSGNAVGLRWSIVGDCRGHPGASLGRVHAVVYAS